MQNTILTHWKMCTVIQAKICSIWALQPFNDGYHSNLIRQRLLKLRGKTQRASFHPLSMKSMWTVCSSSSVCAVDPTEVRIPDWKSSYVCFGGFFVAYPQENDNKCRQRKVWPIWTTTATQICMMKSAVYEGRTCCMHYIYMHLFIHSTHLRLSGKLWDSNCKLFLILTTCNQIRSLCWTPA